MARRSARNRSRVSRARPHRADGRAARGCRCGDAERLARERVTRTRRRGVSGCACAVRARRSRRRLALRLLHGEAWAHIRSRRLSTAAMSALEQAAALAVGAGFTDVDRAEIVFLVGVVRYSRVEHPRGDRPLRPGARPGGRLRRRRIVCARTSSTGVAVPPAQPRLGRRRRRTSSARWSSPKRPHDTRRVADALFQASLVAQRQGRWVLARTDAERSRALFEELGDRATVARLLNNLAGLDHLLGRSRSGAIALLERAFEMFVDLDLPVDAGYVCASLAEIRLACDEPKPAEAQARKALELLGDRVDHLQEVGTAQLALGRALAAQGRLDDAEAVDRGRGRDASSRRSSAGHRSYAWVAQGDLESQRGQRSRLRPVSTGERRARCRMPTSSASAGNHGLPPRAVEGDRSSVSIRLCASCRRTSPRQDWRGGRRLPSLRRRGSAYFPW